MTFLDDVDVLVATWIARNVDQAVTNRDADDIPSARGREIVLDGHRSGAIGSWSAKVAIP